MSNALKRAARTLGQLVASGGLTAIVDQLAGGLSAQQAALVLTGWTVVVSYVHNLLEDSGAVPTVLK